MSRRSHTGKVPPCSAPSRRLRFAPPTLHGFFGFSRACQRGRKRGFASADVRAEICRCSPSAPATLPDAWSKIRPQMHLGQKIGLVRAASRCFSAIYRRREALLHALSRYRTSALRQSKVLRWSGSRRAAAALRSTRPPAQSAREIQHEGALLERDSHARCIAVTLATT